MTRPEPLTVPPGTPLTTPPAEQHLIDQRLTQLEIKASYADDLLDTLNRQVAQQQEAIDLLLREVRRLRHQQAEGDTLAFRSLHDDLPPHY